MSGKGLPWTRLASEVALRTPWLTVSKLRYQVGAEATPREYVVVERNDFVLIVATEEDQLLLVRQYRPGTERFYLALPAGYIDASESPLDAAARELSEETGRGCLNARVIASLDPLPGYVRSRGHVVVCDAVPQRATRRADDLEEPVEIVALAWSEAVTRVLNGEIDEMQAACAILLASHWRRDLGGIR